jgi:hypothetical protein
MTNIIKEKLLKFPINNELLGILYNYYYISFDKFYDTLYFDFKNIYADFTQNDYEIKCLSPYYNEFIDSINYGIYENSEIGLKLVFNKHQNIDLLNIYKPNIIEIQVVHIAPLFRRLSLATTMMKLIFKKYSKSCHFFLKIVPMNGGIGYELTELFYKKFGFIYIKGLRENEVWKE